METVFAWLLDITFWHWWALALLLIGFEILVPSTFLLWPAASAAVMGFILLIAGDMDWRFQLLIFAVLAAASTVAWFRWQSKHPPEAETSNLNTRGQSYVGRRLTLKRGLEDGRGRISIEDTWWSARSDSGDAIAKGIRVEIVDCDGTVMVVREKE